MDLLDDTADDDEVDGDCSSDAKMEYASDLVKHSLSDNIRINHDKC